MASSTIQQRHDSTPDGKPDGGFTQGTGFDIRWQRGPLSVDGVRKEPNGAFVEDVIAAAIGRIEYYQNSEFACLENALALGFLKSAAEVLDQRTKSRTARGVEGTWEK